LGKGKLQGKIQGLAGVGRRSNTYPAFARSSVVGPLAHDRLCQKEAVGMSKSDKIRGVRIGDLKNVLRDRYGHTVPDDDAGREDLFELLLPISLGREPSRKMKNITETWAKWMAADEAAQLIDQINRMPRHERRVKARALGERMRISNEQRERLKLKTIKPFDMTDEQLTEQRKAKDRARKERQRRAAGINPRARSISAEKPWETDGISRAKWYRRRKKDRETNTSAVKLLYYCGTTCLTEKPERPKELARVPETEGKTKTLNHNRRRGSNGTSLRLSARPRA
jgi:hypothetical protein